MKRFLLLLLTAMLIGCFVPISVCLAVPSPPELNIEKTGITIRIKWTAVTDAEGYRLYYAPYPYPGPESIGSIDVGENTEATYTLWDGASYYIAVTAYDETGESRYSNTELFLLTPSLLDTTNTPELTLETNALTFTATWTEMPGATNYRLYYAPYPYAGPESIGSVDVGENTEATYTLWDGAAFYVAVASEQDDTQTGLSNVEVLLTGNPVPAWQNSGYLDADNDGYSVDEGDCDDSDFNIHPAVVEICSDGIDQDCDGEDDLCQGDVDADNDGFTENEGDCDDSDAFINPDATEICEDGIDQDCNGIDLLCEVNIDSDNDGFAENEGDCNDLDASINPGATEVCGDGIDQDCNGSDRACTVSCQGEVINPIPLNIGTPLNQTIAAFGTKYYVFEVSVMGEYTIALYNMTTDNDWKLGEYISNCEDDYRVDHPVIAASSNLNLTDDIKNVQLSPGEYLLVVDEWNNLASSYTLSVTR